MGLIILATLKQVLEFPNQFSIVNPNANPVVLVSGSDF
jgi:hypothetical protein